MQEQIHKYTEAMKLLGIVGIYILVMTITGIGCPFLYITGIPCLGCGMTRACVSMVTFKWKTALYYHPLCVGIPFLAVFIVFHKNMETRKKNVLFGSVIAVFAIVYLVRLLAPSDEIVKMDIENGLIYKIIIWICERRQ